MKILIFLLLNLNSIKEYGFNVCQGLENEFRNNKVEFFGYITEDNQLIITNYGEFDRVESSEIIEYQGKMYCRIQQNSLKNEYKGLLQNRLGIFIPIKATVHSHNPGCVSLDSIGIMSEEDIIFARRYSKLSHYIIGCNALAEFNENRYILLKKKCIHET